MYIGIEAGPGYAGRFWGKASGGLNCPALVDMSHTEASYATQKKVLQAGRSNVLYIAVHTNKKMSSKTLRPCPPFVHTLKEKYLILP